DAKQTIAGDRHPAPLDSPRAQDKIVPRSVVARGAAVRRCGEEPSIRLFGLEGGGPRMAYQDDINLMAHLIRRAGFGAGRDELEARVAKGYEATVEELLHPEAQPPVDAYTLLRYQPASLLPGGQPPMGNLNWMYYLVNTKRPLEEKMALFWHHVFATGNSKVDNYDQLLEQINLFREDGMGNYRDLLLKVAKNPTMIFWLDNQQNH